VNSSPSSERLCSQQIEKLIEDYKEPEKAKRFLMSAGIINENGDLMSRYQLPKQLIREYDCGTFVTGYDQTLREYIEYIEELIEEGWEGIEIKHDYYNEYPCLYKTRYETDAECKARLEQEEKDRMKKIKAEERKRRQYEKLKKEFEPNG
jgi:hypothetical protein